MRREILFAVLLLVPFFLFACRDRRNPQGALVVYKDRVAVIGRARVEPSLGGAGASIDPWQPGNIAIFRVDTTASVRNGAAIRSFTGKAGKVYWINDRYELEEIGQADLGKEDKDLAREYGVQLNP